MKVFNRVISAFCAAGVLLASVSCAGDSIVLEQNQQIELTFSWWGNDARNKYTIEAIKQFEKLHPEINVNCSYSEWSGYESRSRVQMISDTEADVMQINFSWLSEYSEDGLGYYDIYSLSDFGIENFTEDMLAYGIKDGHLNAVPIAMNAESVYVNKSIYDKYGLAVPRTWDDLFNAASVMKNDGIYPMSAASKSMWLYLITYAEQVSGKTILNDNGSLNFTEDEFKTMLEFYKKLVDEKVMPQVEYYERINLDEEMYAGSIAWISDAVNYFGKAIEEKGREIVVADYTTLNGENVGEGWYAKPATMYAVSRNTEYPKESAMLLDYLLNSSQMAVLQGVEKGIPLSKKAKETIEKEGMLTGIQYDASQKMESVTLKELHPILEDGDLINDFFTETDDVLFDMKTIDYAAEEFYDHIKDTYFN